MSVWGVPPDGLPEELLSAYVDGELDADERAAVDARLAESAEWRSILEELTETRAALRSLPPVDASPQFWTDVLASDDVVDLAAARRKRERRPVWKLAVAVAASAVVVVVGVAAIPRQDRVKPAVASFTDAHAARSSVNDDVVSNIASIGVPGLPR